MAECGSSLSQMRASVSRRVAPEQQPPSEGANGAPLTMMRGTIAAKKCDCRKSNGLDADCRCMPSKRSVIQRTTVTSVSSNERRVEATPPPQQGRRFINTPPTAFPVQPKKEKVVTPVTLNGDYGIEVRPLPSTKRTRGFDAYNQQPTHHWMERPATPPIPYDQRCGHPLHRLAYPQGVPVGESRATASSGPMKAHGDPISDVVQTKKEETSSRESKVEASPTPDPREAQEVMTGHATEPRETRDEVPHHRRPPMTPAREAAPRDDREDYHHGNNTAEPGPMYKPNRGYDYEQQMYNYNYRPTMQKQYHSDKKEHASSAVEEPRHHHEHERERASSNAAEESRRHHEHERERASSNAAEESRRHHEHERERASSNAAGHGSAREEAPQEYRQRLEEQQRRESQGSYTIPPAQARHEGYTRQELEQMQMHYEHEQRAQAQLQARAHAQQYDAQGPPPPHEHAYHQEVAAASSQRVASPCGDSVSPCTHSYHYGI